MSWLRSFFDWLFGKKRKPAPAPLFDASGLFLVLGDFSL